MVILDNHDECDQTKLNFSSVTYIMGELEGKRHTAPRKMEKHLVVSVAFLGLLAGISAETLCKDPTWNVLENHYVPWAYCPFTESDYQHKLELRKKYLEKLSANQTSPDWNEINHILSYILKLHPTESYEINNRHILGWYACRGGDKILKYLKNAGWTEKSILKLIRKIYTDFIDSKGYVINFTLSRLEKKLKEAKNETIGGNYEYLCNAILDANFEDFEDPFKPKSELEFPSAPKPPVVKPDSPSNTAPKMKIIQISDIHLDTKYKVGSWADCDLPVCCRENNILPDEKALKAGIYGSWKCDIPLKTLESLLLHIKKKHPDVDYIIWTGDAVTHQFKKRERVVDISTLSKTSGKISKILSGVKVYPAMGHIGPMSSGWLEPKNRVFNLLSLQWGRWLPTSSEKTIRQGGYYTLPIRPGFRLISLNMNYCSKMMRIFIDENEDLKWLISTLEEAEKNNEKVHIIGHIPPSSSICAKSWKTDYYKIINRFESTITAQFFGHTHADEFQIFLDLKDNNRSVGVGFIGPSVVPYTYRNPSYKVYYIEGDYPNSQRYVLDHETWYLDLEKANRENRAEWKKLYSAIDEYKLTSLFPQDMYNFYKNVKNFNKEVSKKYFKNYWINSPKRPDYSISNTNILCSIRSCDIYGPDKFFGFE